MGLLKKAPAAAAPTQSNCVWCGKPTPDNVADCVNCGRRLRVIQQAYQPPAARAAPVEQGPAPIFVGGGPSNPPPRRAPQQSFALPLDDAPPQQAPPPTYQPYNPAPANAPPPPSHAARANETILGVIESIEFNGHNYALTFSNQRMVGARVGYAGGGSSITGALVGAALTAGEKDRRARYNGMSMDQILATDPRNFFAELSWIQQGELNGGVSGITVPKLILVISGKKFVYTFSNQNWARDNAALAQAKQVLWTALGQRMVFKGV